MPAALPGATAASNAANPSAGVPVMYDLLSGPKGSPFDKDTGTYSSTGALSTGIGMGLNVVINASANLSTGNNNSTANIKAAGFYANEIPGATLPSGVNAASSRLMYIGGGRMTSQTGLKGVPFQPTPYITGFGIGGAGNGASRDAGAGPAFTSFSLNMISISAASIANGVVISAPWVNRSGVTIPQFWSVFGSNNTASAVPS